MRVGECRDNHDYAVLTRLIEVISHFWIDLIFLPRSYNLSLHSSAIYSYWQIKEGDQVTLLEPFYRFVDFSWKGKVISDCYVIYDILHLLQLYHLLWISQNFLFLACENHCSYLLILTLQHYQFKSVRVDFVEQLLVNGKNLSSHHAVRTSIYAQHKAWNHNLLL